MSISLIRYNGQSRFVRNSAVGPVQTDDWFQSHYGHSTMALRLPRRPGALLGLKSELC
ncbi:hypothetical protein [Ruegeria sp. 6PALISEP08]|uniref:hypothetical protein n=1 Tax=Ruegeria sp. 6PALISEP08 TaxID=1225660 RepID=UPI0012EEBDD7|nr:hypothetical protein [Ruegeria sp. 6PALISEP08]